MEEDRQDKLEKGVPEGFCKKDGYSAVIVTWNITQFQV